MLLKKYKTFMSYSELFSIFARGLYFTFSNYYQ